MSLEKRAGFTFIEVIVTVAIISLITTLALISYSNVRIKSRDAARVSSINQLMTALQLYKYDTKSYPTAVVAGQPLRAGQITYIGTIPTNPQPRTDGGCADRDFHYAATNDGYMITMCLAEDTGSLKKGVNICTNGQCQPLADYRAHDEEGNAYGAIQVGSQIWLSQNLHAKTNPDGSCINGEQPPCAAGTMETEKPYMCAVDPEECETTGGYYTWNAVMNGSTAEGARGICPQGWHVPSDGDWHQLESFLADNGASCDGERDGGDCVSAGLKLGPNGISGFNFPLAGIVQGLRIHESQYFRNGYAWASTEFSSEDAYFRGIARRLQNPDPEVDNPVARSHWLKEDNMSLRCILD